MPGLAFGVGRDLVQGGRAAGDAAYQAYVRDRYHQPADIWRPDMDLTGAAEDVSVLYAVGSAVANAKTWPTWRDGEAFKAIRDASSAKRR